MQRYLSVCRRIFVCAAIVFSFCTAKAQSFSFTTLPDSMYTGGLDWGDYDNDGDLDLVAGGIRQGGSMATIIYTNNGNGFSRIGYSLPGCAHGNVRWGDYDGDNDLDLVIAGSTGVYVYTNNGNASFVANRSVFYMMLIGNADWGDYDNDGDLDLLLAGTNYPGTLIYQNNNGNFTLTNQRLSTLYSGQGWWGDYDHDGDLDVLFMADSSAANSVVRIYQQTNGNFVKLPDTGLPQLISAYGRWGDMDNDGYPDVVINGNMSNNDEATLYVYRNNHNGSFSLLSQYTTAGNYGTGDLAVLDYNADGYEDVLITGQGEGSSTYRMALLQNVANTGFTSAYSGTGICSGEIGCGDYNNDNRIDFAYVGSTQPSEVLTTRYFTSTNAHVNSAPSTPSDLSTSLSGNTATLHCGYGPSYLDIQTPNGAITFNYFLKNCITGQYLVSPMAELTTGKRHVARNGNGGARNSLTVKNLPDGVYQWSVQSIDAAYASSAFAETQTFVVDNGSHYYIAASGSIVMCGDVSVSMSVYPEAQTYQWQKDGSLAPGDATSRTYTATAPGNYSVLVKGSSNTIVSSVNTIAITGNTAPQQPAVPALTSACAGALVTIAAQPGEGGNTCNWYLAATGGSLYQQATSVTTYATSTITYYVSTYSTTTGCESKTRVPATLQPVPVPGEAIANGPFSGCPSSGVYHLSASPDVPGNSVGWYTSSSAPTPFYTGTQLDTSLQQTTRFYIRSIAPNGCAGTPVSYQFSISGQPGIPTVQPVSTLCAATTAILYASTGTGGSTCRWYGSESSDSILGSGTHYTTPELSNSFTFYVSSLNYTSNCESERVPQPVTVAIISTAPLTENVTRYLNPGTSESVTLYATTPANAATCRWYADSQRRTYLGEGQTYLTPSISATTTYWVCGYNSTTRCYGPMASVLVTITTPPAVNPNPDYIFNIPQCPGTRYHNGVNLFTGDLVAQYPLLSIEGELLSYQLSVRYNSRCAGLSPLVTANEVGGLGWKLCDYPKIAYDAVSDGFWLLMPDRKYALSPGTTTGASTTYAAGEDFSHWKFTCLNSSSSMSLRRWQISTDDGTQYLMENAPVSITEGGSTTSVWNYSKLRDAQLRDSILFTYNGRQLTTISSANDAKLTLSYSNNRLSTITSYALSNSSTSWQDRKVLISYRSFPLNTSYSVIGQIETQVNQDKTENSSSFADEAPPVTFEYSTTNYGGALSERTDATGSSTGYVYGAASANGKTYHPVFQVNSYTGTTHTYESTVLRDHVATTYTYDSLVPSADGMYAQFNQATVLPGVDKAATVFSETKTSFENTSYDPLFDNVPSKYFSTDYALAGTHSIKFDYEKQWFSLYNNRELNSKLLVLTKGERAVAAGSESDTKYKGPQDSVTINFYVYDKHQTLDLKFFLDTWFYDSTGHEVSDPDTTYRIDDSHYGTWIYCTARFAVPQNANTFKFRFSGGDPVGSPDFYMDNVAVLGADYERQGAAVYHFFTGQQRSHLVHLPDEYLQDFDQEKLLSSEYTGFELGDPYDRWITHSGGCKPKAAENSASGAVSYNGSYAYRLSACEDGDRSTMSTKTLNVPHHTDRILVGFNYSNPQISGMTFRLRITQSGTGNIPAIPDTTFTLSGSYFVDGTYKYYQKIAALNNSVSTISVEIKVMSSGTSNATVNNFFLDDFVVLFLQDRQSNPVLAPAVDVTDPLLIGNAYHIRVLTAGQHEIQSNEFVYAPVHPAGKPGYIQLNDMRPASRGAVLSGNQVEYNSDGLTRKMTSGWERTKPDSSHVTVMNRMTQYYAYELYSQLNANHLHQLDDKALTVNYVKSSPDSSWRTTGAELTQWKNFTGLSTTNGGVSALWAPWRSFTLLGQISDADLQAVINGLQNSSTYTPPAPWKLQSTVTAIDGMGNVLEELTEDTIYTAHVFSVRSYSDGSHTIRRGLEETATFTDATAGSVFYNGFETYEQAAFTSSSSYNSNYANTGLRSAATTSAFSVAFHRPSSSGQMYRAGFYIMPNGSTARLQVKNHATGAQLSSTSFPVTANTWQFVETTFALSDTTLTLDFAIDNGSSSTAGYYDDFFFAPQNAVLNAQGYDMLTYEPQTEIDDNAAVWRSYSDPLGSGGVESGPGGQPLGITNNYLSRTNHSTYSPSSPNAATEIIPRGSGMTYNWGDKAQTQQWSTSAATFYPSHVSLDGTHTSYIQLNNAYLPPNHTDWGLSAELELRYTYNPYGSQYFTIDFGGAGVRFRYIYSTSHAQSSSCEVQVMGSSGSWSSVTTVPVSMADQTALLQNVQVVFAGSRMIVWLNGEQVYAGGSIGSATISKVKLATTAGTSGNTVYSQMRVDQLSIFNDPLVRMVYSNGAAASIQEQTVVGNNLVVTETIYDAVQRPEIKTKPALLANTAPGYNAGFVTSFDWSSGKIKGTVTNAANYIQSGDDDANFVYDRTLYHAEPDVNPSLQFNAGKDFALRDKTNWEKAKGWMCNEFPKYLNDAITTAGYVFDAVDIVTNPETAPLVLAVDAGGLLVSYLPMFIDKSNDSETPVTGMTYDAQKNLQAISLPMANRKKHAQKSQVITFGYDYMNQLTLQQYPESGVAHYAYDQSGHLRFAQTEDNKQRNITQYFKYDGFGRVIESGYWNSPSWDQSYMNTKANVPGFPAGTGVTVTNLNYYNGLNSDSAWTAAKRGRLTSRRTNNSDGSYTTETFWYDAWEHVTGVKTSLTSASGSTTHYSVSYACDMTGNIVKTTYPAFNNTAFQVTETYDKQNNAVNIGTPANATEYATYRWNPDGTAASSLLYGLSGKRLHNSYAYNAPAWNTSIAASDSSSATMRTIMTDTYNYNFIDDWWQSLWGEKYYNGDVAQSKTSHYNSYNNYVDNNKGLVYDSLGRLLTSYNDEHGTSFNDGGTSNYPWHDAYDLNGNLTQHRLIYSGDYPDTINHSFVYDQQHNRLNTVNVHTRGYGQSTADHIWSYDTLYVTPSRSGYYTNLNYRGHTSANFITSASGDSTSARTFTWTAGGLLETASWDNRKNNTVKSSGNMRIVYDGQSDRLQKISTSGNTTTTTTYIRGNSSAPLLEVVQSGSSVTYNYYVQAPDGIIAMVQKSGSTTQSWLVLKDRQGSTQQLVDRSTGSSAVQFFYENYGIVYKQGSMNFSYLFNGQEYDPETQLYYFEARMYDPWLRQFLSPDPAHQDYALPYAYTGYDPVNHIDPDGRTNLLEVVGAADHVVEAAKAFYAGMSLEQMLDIRGRSFLWKVEFRRRLNSADPEILEEIRELKRKSTAMKRAARAAGQPVPKRTPFTKFKEVMRPGKQHEFFNVANTADWLERGLLVDDIQTLVQPTVSTNFAEVVNPAVPHNHNTSKSVSSLAHREAEDMLREIPIPPRNPTDMEANRQLMYQRAQAWINQTYAGQRYTFHVSTTTAYDAIVTRELGTKRKFYAPDDARRIKKTMYEDTWK